MTPQELHAALEDRRRTDGLKRWQLAVALDISLGRLGEMRNGTCSPALRERAETWLERARGD